MVVKIIVAADSVTGKNIVSVSGYVTDSCELEKSFNQQYEFEYEFAQCYCKDSFIGVHCRIRASIDDIVLQHPDAAASKQTTFSANSDLQPTAP